MGRIALPTYTPVSVVYALNEFILDALDLGNEELEGYRLDAIKNSQSIFWITLGKSEEEREKRFDFLLKQKTVYCFKIRICIAKALEDVRYYRCAKGNLCHQRNTKRRRPASVEKTRHA
ncbi:unnamed protein product [Cylicocyclus nassatus]|uniref:Uncharacterized protein n=1 Tax=Cylicocyclus nassatus TaxID=53992 RepID=A0AA36GUB6_CYLNA|nr:unnamed protein product [Cylicocyclus nassatus]